MENKNIQVEKLYDEQNNLVCDEIYFQFYENAKPSPLWVEGLKWVYDAYDQTGDKEFDDAIDFLDDDQEKMMVILSYFVLKKAPGGKLVSIFGNYMFNEDGSKNLIKQICLIFEFGQTSYFVIRAPFYAFTEYALNDIIKKIESEAK